MTSPRARGTAETDPPPGPAPVGPAVSVPQQTPVKTPKEPEPAPVGPAVRPEDQNG
jgi:hypothetical protein